jgi:choline-sulfatase
MELREQDLVRGLAALLTLALNAPCRAAPPNVVLITIDTLRADHVGCYGDREARTPSLDALAHDGVLFRTVVASVPLTLPSHCSILTGAYPTLHGVRDNLGYNLPEDQPTLATILKANGYSTAAFVGADVLDPRRGLNRGFDTYSGPFERRMTQDNPLVSNLQDLQRRAEEVVADAIRWMDAQPSSASGPSFVWIHLYDPHTPYDPPARFRALVSSPYDGEIAYADYAIGEFFRHLKDRGLYDSTLIVATSDHGESFGEHGEYTHGYFVYDTTLLVPLIIKPPAGPGLAKPKAALQPIETPVRSVDIAPTILQFLGIHSASSMQGSGLLSLIEGKTTNATTATAYCESYYPTEFGWSALRALRNGRFKYIDAPKPELYDLAADPGELHNLYHRQHALAAELADQFAALVAKLTPQVRPQRTTAPADLELLASLGYVGTSIPSSAPSHPRNLPDPKDELGTYKVLSSAAQMAAEGKCASAIPMLARLTEEQPSLFLGYLTLGKCHLAAGQLEMAGQALASAVRLQPGNLEAVFYEGIYQFQAGRLEDSRSTLQLVAKALPEEPYVHFYLGQIAEQESKPDEALAEFQACERLDAQFEVAVYKAGYLLAKAGRFQEAAVQFRKVIALDPSNAAAHRNLALAYARSGNDEAAGPEFEAACRLNAAMCVPQNRQ